jgi:hypothetical protein
VRVPTVSQVMAVLLVALTAALLATSASAAPTWKTPLTVASPVRGIPEPMVAMDRAGRATIVFDDAPVGDFGPLDSGPGVYAVVRGRGSTFTTPVRIGSGGEPRLAVTPDGATAIAWVDGSKVRLMFQPAPGRLAPESQVRSAVDAGPGGATDLQLKLDADGRSTLVWKSRTASDGPAEVRLHALAIASDGTVGAVQELGPSASCPGLSFDANLAGDAAVLCATRNEIYVRDAGEAIFEAEPLEPLAGNIAGYVLVDGAGTTTVVVPVRLSLSWTLYKSRPRGGVFVQEGVFDGHTDIYGQEGRTVAVRYDDRQVVYAIRPAGAETFEAPRRSASRSLDVVRGLTRTTAPLGPLPLLGITDFNVPGTASPLSGIAIRTDGGVQTSGLVPVPGQIDFSGNVAGSENGLAVATWEQRCGNGFAVMAMVLDEQRGSTAPPCQDRLAPKVAVRPKRAGLVGRTLRVRIGCNELCRLGVRVRVLRGGRGKPLATAKTRGGRRIAAGRYSSFTLRLIRSQAAKVRAARASRRRVTVRLALPVRDSYENGAVRRVAVPLRR